MNPLYFQAEFLLSAPNLSHCPNDQGAEVAFAGRSNAGKSSALNVITNQVGLARTSKTPGRTQQIVFFELNKTQRLVDLPGYGFAKVPEAVRLQWQQALEQYMRERKTLRGVILIMDSRRPFTDLDIAMLDWCQSLGLHVHVLLTKADKLKPGPRRAALLSAQREMGHNWPDYSVQLFSSLKKTGVDEAHKVLDGWISQAAS